MPAEPTQTPTTATSDRFNPPPYSSPETARRVLTVWRDERNLTLVGVAYAFGYVLLSLTVPLLIARAIDDSIVSHKEPLAPLLIVIAALSLLRFWFNFQRRYVTSKVGINMETRMRALLYDAYLKFPRAFYDRQPTGQVLSRATNDLYPIRYFMGWGLVQVVQSMMMILGTAILLVITDPELAVLSAIPMPLILYIAWRFGGRVTPISRAVQARKADVTDAANEAVVGIEMVQAFGREDIVLHRFSKRAQAIKDEMLRQARVESTHLPAIYYLPSLSVAIVLAVGGRQVIHGSLSYGQLTLFIQLLLQIVWPLEALGYLVDLGQRALASAGRAFTWLEQIPTLPDVTAAPAGAAVQQTPPVPLSVTFTGVHFAYPDSSEVLSGIDLQIKPGEIVAFCGRTGAGKSTLLSLLSRNYDPDSGAVAVGGTDLRQIPLTDLRGAISVVNQRPILFSSTLRENLLTGRPDATDAELERACAQAGLAKTVANLPDGLQTVIGERGVNLSGGQRQRVALARAFLASGSVVILDDPLSAVDTETEVEIVSQLREALRGRTTLMAAQRLSTLSFADRIVVVSDGQIERTGSVSELLENSGTFKDLFGDEALAEVF